MSRPRRVVDIVLLAAGVLLVAATFAGFGGGWWWRFDILSSFRAQYLVAALVLGVAAAFRAALSRHGAAARSGLLMLAAVALVNLAAVAPLYRGGREAAAPGAEPLRIVSFNVQASNPDRSDVMEYLRAADADLIFLLESSFEWEDAVERAGLPYTIASRVPRDRTFGITLLAAEAADARIVRLGPDADPAVAATVVRDGTAIDVLGVHPVSPTTADRARRRDSVLAEAGLWAAGRGDAVVVVGDLNASPWSHAFRRLARTGGLHNSQRGHGLQPTWPAGWGPLMIPIDHALHGDGLAVTARATGPPLGSDHRPLEVEFARAAPRVAGEG